MGRRCIARNTGISHDMNIYLRALPSSAAHHLASDGPVLVQLRPYPVPYHHYKPPTKKNADQNTGSHSYPKANPSSSTRGSLPSITIIGAPIIAEATTPIITEAAPAPIAKAAPFVVAEAAAPITASHAAPAIAAAASGLPRVVNRLWRRLHRRRHRLAALVTLPRRRRRAARVVAGGPRGVRGRRGRDGDRGRGGGDFVGRWVVELLCYGDGLLLG